MVACLYYAAGCVGRERKGFALQIAKSIVEREVDAWGGLAVELVSRHGVGLASYRIDQMGVF